MLVVLPLVAAAAAGQWVQSTNHPSAVLRSLAIQLAFGLVVAILGAVGAIRLARLDTSLARRVAGMVGLDIVVLAVFGGTFLLALATEEPSAAPAAFTAAPGVCLTANVTSEGVEAPWEGTAVDCASQHQIELIGVVASTAASYPSSADWEAMSHTGCHAAFLDYVGRPFDQQRDSLVWYGPTSDEWSAGNRNLVCGVYAPAGQTLSGSVKGTGR